MEEAESDPFAFRHAISVHYVRRDAPFVDLSAGASVPPGKSAWDDAPDLTTFLRQPTARRNGVDTEEKARKWIRENKEHYMRMQHKGYRLTFLPV